MTQFIGTEVGKAAENVDDIKMLLKKVADEAKNLVRTHTVTNTTSVKRALPFVSILATKGNHTESETLTTTFSMQCVKGCLQNDFTSFCVHM